MLLSNVKHILNSVPSINYGGCGLSALAMYRWLKDTDSLKGDEHFVYLYTRSDGNFETNCEVLDVNSKNQKLGSASHIMLYHNGMLHDSKGNSVNPFYVHKHENLTENQLIESLNNGFWNDSFNRKRFLPEISKALNINLGDVNPQNN